jgi:uncharacterized protein (TIGR00255 family)
MIVSMTGFASKTATCTLKDGSQVNIAIDIKTLNSRFFETTCKLSYAINHLETELLALLKKRFVRGHVYMTIHVLNPQTLQGGVTASVPTIQGYVNAVEQIKKSVSVGGTLSVSDLINLPDVFIVEEKEIDRFFEEQILRAVDALAVQVNEARKVEGIALAQDLRNRFAIMETEIQKIEVAAEELIITKKQEIAQAIQEIDTTEDETAEARKSALYIALDKMDIHEEIVRFKSHLKNIILLLITPDAEKGKRLDFTLQELAREINTLSAKCSDATITGQAINIKVELEKAREQTQNIV